MKNRFLFIAVLSGFFCVAFGAFAAHGLSPLLSEKGQVWIDTGLKYQMFHTLALMGLAIWQQYSATCVKWIGLSWLCGILLFSGSLYALALGGAKFLVWLTPMGGTLFLLGWALFAYKVYKNK